MDQPTLIRIFFVNPGFFLADGRLEVRLGEQVVYDGSFLSGFDQQLAVAPGPHTLTTTVLLGPLSRNKRYTLDVPPAEPRQEPILHAQLRYSRFWGNFKSKLRLFR